MRSAVAESHTRRAGADARAACAVPCNTALEARLHRPDVAHIGRDTALNRELFGLTIEHIIGSEMECRNRILAGRFISIPFLEHLMPQQRRKQEARRDRLTLTHTFVGVSQRQRDEALAERLL